MTFEDEVREALDDVLTAAGLPWNQTGPGDHGRGFAVLFCGPAGAYLDRFPHLGGDGWMGHASCVDLIVRGGPDGVASVTVEGEDLSDVLRRATLPDLAAELQAAIDRRGPPSTTLPIAREAALLLFAPSPGHGTLAT